MPSRSGSDRCTTAAIPAEPVAGLPLCAPAASGEAPWSAALNATAAASQALTRTASLLSGAETPQQVRGRLPLLERQREHAERAAELVGGRHPQRRHLALVLRVDLRPAIDEHLHHAVQ